MYKHATLELAGLQHSRYKHAMHTTTRRFLGSYPQRYYRLSSARENTLALA